MTTETDHATQSDRPTEPSSASPTIEHEVGPAGTVTVRGFDGSIDLRAVGGTTARVWGSGPRPLEEDYRVERSADRLELTAVGRQGFGLRWILGDRCQPIRLEVPAGTLVRLETASGDLRATGLTGEQGYRTMSGDVSVDRVGGAIVLETVSGDVRVSAEREIRLEARTVSGDLEVTAPELAAFQARTTSGDLRVAARLSGSGPYAVETASGNATIAPDGPIRIEGTTVSGDVRSSIPHRSSGQAGRRTIELGDGGPLVRFRSISGDLRVETRGALPLAPRPAPPVAPLPPAAPMPPAVPAVDVEALRLAILRDLEAGTIDVATAEARLAGLDTPAGPTAATAARADRDPVPPIGSERTFGEVRRV